jgi:hypothetical protein
LENSRCARSFLLSRPRCISLSYYISLQKVRNPCEIEVCPWDE